MRNGIRKMPEAGLPMLVPAVASVLDCIMNCLEVNKRSEMQKAEIHARTEAAIAMIRNRREAMVSYLNGRFSERAMLFDGYFSLVEKALDSGNDELMQSALDGILQIYRSSPAENIDRLFPSVAAQLKVN